MAEQATRARRAEGRLTASRFRIRAWLTLPTRDSRWLRWYPVWRRNLRVWQRLAVPSLLANFGEPLLYILALGYGLGALVGEVGNLPYPVYLASGIVCSSAMITASMESMYSAYSRMAVQNTWDAITTAPLDTTDVVLGEAAWSATKSTISGLAIFAVALALGAVANPLLVVVLVPLIWLIGLCFGAMALIVTLLARSFDFFLYYTTLCVTPMFMLSGVFFPLDKMPLAVQALSQAMPLTHAVALVRPLMTGTMPSHALLHLAVLLAVTVVSLLIAARLARRRLAT